MSENQIFRRLYEFIFPKKFFRRNLWEGRHLCLMPLRHIVLLGSTHLSGSSGNGDPECLSGFTTDWKLPALPYASSNHLSSQFTQYIFVTEPSPRIQVCVPNALVSQNTEKHRCLEIAKGLFDLAKAKGQKSKSPKSVLFLFDKETVPQLFILTLWELGVLSWRIKILQNIVHQWHSFFFLKNIYFRVF